MGVGVWFDGEGRALPKWAVRRSLNYTVITQYRNWPGTLLLAPGCVGGIQPTNAQPDGKAVISACPLE